MKFMNLVITSEIEDELKYLLTAYNKDELFSYFKLFIKTDDLSVLSGDLEYNILEFLTNTYEYLCDENSEFEDVKLIGLLYGDYTVKKSKEEELKDRYLKLIDDGKSESAIEILTTLNLLGEKELASYLTTSLLELNEGKF